MIIGISGKARSGKDQFGEYLIEAFEEKYDRKFYPKAFAFVLKDMCAQQFGLIDDQLYGDKKEAITRYGKNEAGRLGLSSNPNDYWTSREIMQEVGSFYRKIDYDFWVRELDKNIEYDIARDLYDFIITDVRHVNECNYIKNKNGVLVRVIRECADEIHGMEHESETSLDNFEGFDFEINNDGTLEDLKQAAVDCASMIVSVENLMKKRRTI